jgi:hypothetical protein
MRAVRQAQGGGHARQAIPLLNVRDKLVANAAGKLLF